MTGIADWSRITKALEEHGFGTREQTDNAGHDVPPPTRAEVDANPRACVDIYAIECQEEGEFAPSILYRWYFPYMTKWSAQRFLRALTDERGIARVRADICRIVDEIWSDRSLASRESGNRQIVKTLARSGITCNQLQEWYFLQFDTYFLADPGLKALLSEKVIEQDEVEWVLKSNGLSEDLAYDTVSDSGTESSEED